MTRPGHDTSIGQSDAVALVSHGDAYLGETAALDVRTVLLRDAETFQHFATVARVVPLIRQRSVCHEVRDAVLVRNVFPCDKVSTWDALRSALAQWRLDVGTSSGYQFHPSLRIYRFRRKSHWDELPCWVLEGEEDVAGAPAKRRSPPHEAYLSTEAGVFAESFGNLAAEFLGAPEVANWNAFNLTYRLIVPDRSGVIRSVERTERSAVVTVDSSEPSLGLVCAAVALGFDNGKMRVSSPVEGGKADLRFPRAAKLLDIWLMLEGGDWLDRYEEVSVPRGWWSAYHGQTDVGLVDSLNLMNEIDQGESETMEFKPWIDLRPGDSKRREILRTVCAFANSKGGSLLIGVADSTELLPFSKERKALGHGKGSLDDAMDEYAAQLRRFLTQGVRPQASVDIRWEDLAGHNILRVRVTRGDETPHSLSDNGDIFVRRGATSRKMRQDEAIEFLHATKRLDRLG